MMADLPAGGVGRYEVAIVPLCIQKWEKNSRAKNRLCKCVFLSLIPPLKSAEDIAHLVDAEVAHLLGKWEHLCTVFFFQCIEVPSSTKTCYLK